MMKEISGLGLLTELGAKGDMALWTGGGTSVMKCQCENISVGSSVKESRLRTNFGERC